MNDLEENKYLLCKEEKDAYDGCNEATWFFRTNCHTTIENITYSVTEDLTEQLKKDVMKLIQEISSSGDHNHTLSKFAPEGNTC